MLGIFLWGSAFILPVHESGDIGGSLLQVTAEHYEYAFAAWLPLNLKMLFQSCHVGHLWFATDDQDSVSTPYQSTSPSWIVSLLCCPLTLFISFLQCYQLFLFRPSIASDHCSLPCHLFPPCLYFTHKVHSLNFPLFSCPISPLLELSTNPSSY